MFACLAVAAIAVAQQAGGDWKPYANVRFAYSVQYPADQLRAGREADNSDGKVFTALHGSGTISVSGHYALEATSQRDEAADAEKECAGGKATYRLNNPKVQAVSCTLANGKVLYQYSQSQKDVIATIRAEYPASEKATWDQIVPHMVHSLRMEEPSF